MCVTLCDSLSSRSLAHRSTGPSRDRSSPVDSTRDLLCVLTPRSVPVDSSPLRTAPDTTLVGSSRRSFHFDYPTRLLVGTLHVRPGVVPVSCRSLPFSLLPSVHPSPERPVSLFGWKLRHPPETKGGPNAVGVHLFPFYGPQPLVLRSGPPSSTLRP